MTRILSENLGKMNHPFFLLHIPGDLPAFCFEDVLGVFGLILSWGGWGIGRVNKGDLFLAGKTEEAEMGLLKFLFSSIVEAAP